MLINTFITIPTTDLHDAAVIIASGCDDWQHEDVSCLQVLTHS
ncbi:MAG: hypothetical protein AAF806_03210 [Bacteroidota bacterium]